MLVSRRVSTKFSGTLIFEGQIHPASSPQKKLHHLIHLFHRFEKMGAHAQEAVSSSGERICAKKSGNYQKHPTKQRSPYSRYLKLTGLRVRHPELLRFA